MSDRARHLIRSLARPMTSRVAGKPLGIWIAWAGLLYAVYSLMPKLLMIAGLQRVGAPMLAEAVAVTLPMLAALVALAMRRQISQVLVGISMAFLMHRSIYLSDSIGAIVALAGFCGVMVNRRWFIDRLPNVMK
ncbi:MAG: hypothetical protein JXA24_01645 [Proteobacteria bacterium]|nr:hypothetical protein [Pseudomonadota bacterium]